MYAAPVFSWTGFYLGGNVGYGWTSGSGTLTTAAGSEPVTLNGDSFFLGGAQAGYNYQVGPAVLGAEVDFQGSTASDSFNAAAGPVVGGTQKVPYFGTLRGRVGFAWDRVLVYATGGGVYGDSTTSGNISTAGGFSSSASFWSWTAGAGVEFAFWNCWSAKLEYLYIASPSSLPAIPTVTAMSEHTNNNIVRVGLNYHF
jgi:outer membrane immunogenic protein